MLHHAARRVEQLLKHHRSSSLPSPSSSSPSPSSSSSSSSPASSTQPKPPSNSSKLGPKASYGGVDYMYGVAVERTSDGVISVFVGIAWRDPVDIRRHKRASIQ